MNTLFTATIRHQLALLDAYAAALERNWWGEARMNEAMKSWQAILLPALQAQCALAEQTLTAQRELIDRYRGHLEAALRREEAPAP